MYPARLRSEALARIAGGHSLSGVSRELGIARSTLRTWRDHGITPERAGECPGCQGADLEPRPYACLLGFYLGDGCISAARRYYALRIACDARYPGIICDATDAVLGVRPGSKVFHVRAPGTVVVQAHWKHWPCLFPQHGPGRKHERPIVLEEWQRAIVREHPGDFLRGLFHSDGFTLPPLSGGRTQPAVRRRGRRWSVAGTGPPERGTSGGVVPGRRRPRCRDAQTANEPTERPARQRYLDELIGPKT